MYVGGAAWSGVIVTFMGFFLSVFSTLFFFNLPTTYFIYSDLTPSKCENFRPKYSYVNRMDFNLQFFQYFELFFHFRKKANEKYFPVLEYEQKNHIEYFLFQSNIEILMA